MKSWIYIASNESLPNLLKVGTTDRDPESRMNELFSTGVPTPFNLEYFCLLESAFDIEQLIHEELDQYRVNKNREFFNCNVAQIIISIKEITEKHSREIFFEKHNSYQSLFQLNNDCLEKIRARVKHSWDTAQQKTFTESLYIKGYLHWLIQEKKINEYIQGVYVDVKKHFYIDFNSVSGTFPESLSEDFFIKIYMNHFKQLQDFGIIFTRDEIKNISCEISYPTPKYRVEFMRYCEGLNQSV